MEEDGKANWHFNPNEDTPADDPGQAATADISWQAVEFIEHPHPPSWYTMLMGATALLTVLVYFITKDIIATVTIPIIGVIVAFFAKHKPGVASYEISNSGLTINKKNYPFSSFKSFSVSREGEMASVNLLPTKRLMPPVSAYFDPADEDKITNALGEHLPLQEHKLDAIDKLTRRLRL